MRSTSKENILAALQSGPMEIEDLALKLRRAKTRTYIDVDNDFRDDLWTLLDSHEIDLDIDMKICLPK